MYKMQETTSDGGIVTFKSTHPKWSFAKVDENGLVTEVAEKNPISDNATVGYYFWKHGSDFVKYAEQMIEKNIRVNNEFYVCPVFNQAIEDAKKIRTFNVERMWGLGTPEDLHYYLEHYV
jgi:dTDP-glucose pyrophosphorylase